MTLKSHILYLDNEKLKSHRDTMFVGSQDNRSGRGKR